MADRYNIFDNSDTTKLDHVIQKSEAIIALSWIAKLKRNLLCAKLNCIIIIQQTWIISINLFRSSSNLLEYAIQLTWIIIIQLT